MVRWFTVANTSNFKSGSRLSTQIGDKTVAVFNVDGTIYALEDYCPHAGALLSEGPIEGNTIVCPWHAAAFELETGDLIEGPCFRGVQRYDVKIQGGKIQIAVPDDQS